MCCEKKTRIRLKLSLRRCVLPYQQLDYKVDDAKLREVFRLAGKVVVAEVVKDRDGRSRGFGVLQMSHPVEAVQV